MPAISLGPCPSDGCRWPCAGARCSARPSSRAGHARGARSNSSAPRRRSSSSPTRRAARKAAPLHRACRPAGASSRRMTGSSAVRLYRRSPSAAGIGLCGGYRHDLFDRNARCFEAGMSMRNYQMLRADFSLPYLAREPRRARRAGHLSARPAGRLLGSRRRHPRRTTGSAISSTTPTIRAAPSSGRCAGSRPARGSGGSTEIGQRHRHAVSVDRGALQRRRRRRVWPQQPDFSLRRAVRRRRLPRSAGQRARRRLLRAHLARYSDLDLDRYSFRAVDAAAPAVLPHLRQEARLCAAGAPAVAATDTATGRRCRSTSSRRSAAARVTASFNDFRFRDDSAWSI